MKKIISVLLTAAMVLSLAGCAKEEETTKKKKKTKKTTESEETTDVPTDDPTESTDEPTSSTEDPATDTTPVVVDTTPSTDATSDPSTNPGPGNNPVQSLHTTIGVECAGFGAFNDEEWHMDSVRILIEYPVFNEVGYDDLEEAVLGYYSSLETVMIEQYEENVEAFTNGNLPAYNSMQANTYIYRDDSYIFSVMIDRPSMFSEDDQSCDTHSFFSETGEEIALDDIITDKAAVLEAIKDYYAAIYRDTAEVSQDFIDAYNAGKCPFTLTYDGIFFFIGFTTIKVPLSAIYDAVDVRYFGNAPDSYFLNLDAKLELEWDLDGDGQGDLLSVEGKTDAEGFLEEIVIHHNGQDSVISDSVWGEFHAYDDNYVMVTSDGIYMYLLLGIDEGMEYAAFAYKNGSWSSIGTFENGEFFYGQAYDPSCVNMSRYFDVLGTHYYYAEYNFEGNQGMPEMDVILFQSVVFLLEAAQDIPCYEMDEYLNVTGEGTIPKGACVNVSMYDPEYNQVLLEVSFADYSQNYYVSADVSEAYPHTISGIPVDEAFNGLFYGG